MKLSNTITAEFKNSSHISSTLFSMNPRGDMVVPGACSCSSLGCCCSCSCGATSKK